MKNVEKLIEQALLYDFYSELLTKQQRKIYEEVFFDDLSLSEVADNEGVTRQGVYDMIKRTQGSLLKYEKKLGLVKRYNKEKDIIERLEMEVKNLPKDKRKNYSDLIKELKDI